MKYIKIFVWVMIFIITEILFNLRFTMLYTPAGMMGEATYTNTLASLIYLLCWFALALYSGINSLKYIMTAAIIYSILPALGYISGIIFKGTKLTILILFTFFWAVPTQGLCFGNEQVIISMMFIQPLLFIAGYYIPRAIYIRRKPV